MKDIIIIGSSGHANVVIDIVEKQNKYNIVGLIDDFRQKGELVLGYKVIGMCKQLPELCLTYHVTSGVVAIGDNFTRHEIMQKMLTLVPQFNFISTVHPMACIGKSVSIGRGSVVMSGATINPNCIIGEFCICNTSSSIDHDSSLGDFSSLAPGVTIGGNVKIGSFTAVGIGSTVIHNLHIGKHNVIGAGSTVLNGVGDCKVIYGSPAKIIRGRVPGDNYL